MSFLRTARAREIAAPFAIGDGAERIERAKPLRRVEVQQAIAARNAAGLTQEQLAEALETKRDYVRAWEREDRDNCPRTDHLRRGPRAWRRSYVLELAAVDGDLVQPAPAEVFGDNDAARVFDLTKRLANAQRAACAMVIDGGGPVQMEMVIRDGQLALAALSECIESAKRRQRARRRR